MKLRGALCELCPLKDAPVVPPQNSTSQCRFIILAGSPARVEVNKGYPLAGPTGFFVERCLESAGLSRDEAHVTNVIACYSEHKQSAKVINEAARCCASRLRLELDALPNTPVLSLGPLALSALEGRKMNPMAWFGYPLGHVFPLFMPTLALIDPRYRSTAQAMIRRFARWVKGDRLQTFPDMCIDQPEAREILRSMRGKPIAIDVENAGEPLFERLLCVGVSDGNVSVSLEYPEDDCSELRELLADAETVKIYHNMQHDRLCLEANGYTLAGPVFDTLVAHAALLPLLPHNLSFCSATLLAFPRWKSEFADEGEHKGVDLFTKSDPRKRRVYNAKDAYVTARLYNVLKTAMDRDPRAPGIYSELMQLSEIATSMRKRGILFDHQALISHQTSLATDLATSQQAFSALNLPPTVQLGDSGGSKSLNRHFFNTLGITPYAHSEITGAPKLDSWTLSQIVATGGAGADLAAIVLKTRRASKLKGTYATLRTPDVQRGLLVTRDNRVHPSWSPWRVPGGRWGCSDPNMMNIPKDVKKRNLRDMFIAAPGNVFVAADCDKAELRVIAHLAEDVALLTAFAQGTDVHTQNAKNIFPRFDELPKKDQKSMRDFAKRFVYGANYGGEAETLWKSLVVEFPKTGLMLVHELLQRWKLTHREIYQWHQRRTHECFQAGISAVPTGVERRAALYRKDSADGRFAINMAMQGVVASFVNWATIELHKELERTKIGWLVIQCHDELVVECPEANKLQVARLLKAKMETPHLVDGRELVIPAEPKWGYHWGKMEPIGAL